MAESELSIDQAVAAIGPESATLLPARRREMTRGAHGGVSLDMPRLKSRVCARKIIARARLVLVAAGG
jgi:hypothetical protein